jgi:DNA invertase Pin-like site-specific DNA recombinase
VKTTFGRIYGRFSSMPQERGDSKRRQVEGATKYASKNGITIVGQPYFDEGVSGKAGLNLEKEFGRLLTEARDGELILVEALDRIGRQNPFILGKLLYDTVQKGITVVAWQEGKTITKENIDTLETQFSVFTGAAVGHADNMRKMNRLRETTQEAYRLAEKGIQSGTLVKYLPQCFKWNQTAKRIEVWEDRAKVIRRIFRDFNSGIGKTTLCQNLNIEGVPTLYGTGKNTKGRKHWLETSVTKILRNESYAGVLEVKGKRFTCIPKVVGREAFDRAQMLLQRFSQRHGNYSRGRVNNLFRDLGICAHCGGTITVSVAPPKKEGNKTCYQYRCQGKRLKANEDAECKHGRMLNAEVVECLFFEHYFGGSPENILVGKNTELKSKLAALQSRVEELDKKISNLYDLAEEGDTEAKTRIAERKEEKAAAQREIGFLKGSMVEQEEMPSAMDEIDSLMPWTKEYGRALNEFYPKLKKALSDNETRKKLVHALPLIFSKVRFDTVERTLQPITKEGKEMVAVDLDSINLKLDYEKRTLYYEKGLPLSLG